MPRFRLLIEYAGTKYCGWQIQKNARTVAGEIERAVFQATGRREFELYGSGRTDAGVHAVGQVAHLDIYTELTPELLLMRNDNGDTPLHVAAQNGFLTQIPSSFLTEGTVNISNHVGVTVRRLAISRGFGHQLPPSFRPKPMRFFGNLFGRIGSIWLF